MSWNPGEVDVGLSFCFLNGRNHGQRDPSQHIAVSAQGRNESVQNETFTLTLLDVFFLSFCAPPVYYRRGQWHPTPVLLPGKSHGWRSLVGCSPWGCEESDTTERLHFHFSLSCIGEGNGNPLQCSCLENPRDWGAWWAAVYGMVQSWTWLKRLSSSSSSSSVL